MNRTLLFIVLLCLPSQNCHSHSKWISFADVIDQSSIIVVAEFLGEVMKKTTEQKKESDLFVIISHQKNYLLRVVRVLKGAVNADTLIVHSVPDGDVTYRSGTMCIAFINGNNEFEWSATAMKLENQTSELISGLSSDVIMLGGFYNWNAYGVSPSVITYTNLTDYIKDGHMKVNSRGHIYFFDVSTKQMEPSEMEISVSYYYSKDSVRRIVEEINFPTSTFKIEEDSEWGYLSNVAYSRNIIRPFAISGEYIDNSERGFTMMYYIDEPEEISEEQLIAYLKDPSLSYPVHEIEIIVDERDTVIFLYEEYLSLSTLTFNGNSTEANSLQVNGEGFFFSISWDDGTILTIDQQGSVKGVRLFTDNDLTRELRINDLKGRITSELWDDKPCSIRIVGTSFRDFPE